MVIPLLLIPIGTVLWSLCYAHRILNSRELLDREDKEQEAYLSALK